MAFTKKTYSRNNNEQSDLCEKENFDPFDELLSSPLKQEVQFKPLSYWESNNKCVERKSTKSFEFGLFEESNSVSPQDCRRKKHRLMFSKWKRRALPARCKIDENSNISCSNTFIKAIKSNVPLVPCENAVSLLCKEACKHKYQLSDNSLYFDNCYVGRVDSSFVSSPDLKYVTVRKRHNKGSTGDHQKLSFMFSPRIEKGGKKHDNFDENNTSFNFIVSLEEGCENVNESQNISNEDDKDENMIVAISDELINTSQGLGNNMSYNKEEDSRHGDMCFNESTNEFCNSFNCKGYTGDPDASVSSTFGSDKTCLYNNFSTVLKNTIESVSVAEFASVDIDWENLAYLNSTELEDLIQELLLGANENSTICNEAESTLISEENSFYCTDEESVIRLSVQPHTEGFGNDKELQHRTTSSPREVSHLMSGFSRMSISDAKSLGESLQHEHDNSQNIQNNTRCTDAKNNSVVGDLRNVTTKRRYLNFRYRQSHNAIPVESPSPSKPKPERNPERQWKLNETLESSAMGDKIDFDWNKTLYFANPVLESTRVQDVSSESGKYSKPPTQSEKMASLLEDSQAWRQFSYSLKPGKKWLRAMSILKQIRNGNATADRFDGSRVKGRKFESFVKDVLEMQTGEPGWSTSFADMTYSTTGTPKSNLKTPLSHSVRNFNGSLMTSSNSVFGMTDSERTMLETSLVNPTIKMIHPDEKSSALRLEDGHGSPDDVKSSIVSAKSYILHECGQEDVLPFEEYFNEGTLKDCKKIGEGVYGEVFMSSNSVIKIIPIEGTERVNGEPQKKFEEILSEVVIALKLSNLRNGVRNRSDGFSEVKRCWCVRGKYPKYLLELWDEYDQAGRGSENDSPIMFREDQLYIILEFANGGKDLESFVFTSSAQSLSILVQTAASLAAAERALEFEHRDLHWGNVLISPTTEKFVAVTVDGTELKIPSRGVKVCIIDFTLSRIYHNGFCIFNDLSVDPGLFQSEGDYQFEIYKMMLGEVMNDWSLFRPKTNIFWLHYTLDKMMTLVRYKSKKGKVHRKYEKDLRILESEILNYKDSSDFVLGETISDVIKRL